MKDELESFEFEPSNGGDQAKTRNLTRMNSITRDLRFHSVKSDFTTSDRVSYG